MKGVFVILDGVADEPCTVLKNKTPLESARTPNLDFFANSAAIDHCFPIAQGIAPQSSSGLISLFGADFRDYPRGLLEAVGAGVKLDEGDLVFRCNFSTIENLNTLKIVDRRVGRTLTTTEAYDLAQAVNAKVSLPFKFELIPTVGHRAILIFKGTFSSKISNVDPSYEFGLSVEGENNVVKMSKPYEESNKAKLSADLLNTFVRKSYVVLENHPINALRKKKGFFPANFILCRDPGSAPLVYRKLNGSWMGLGYMPLEIGVIKLFEMRSFSFIYPKMEGIDFYQHAEEVLGNVIKKAVEMIDKNKDFIDYFYVHFKETDLPGHDNKPMQKVKFIEMIDKGFFGYLSGLNNFKLLVTADHTTSCRTKNHTSHPVPVLFYQSGSPKDSKKRFIEKDGLMGKQITGRQLLQKTLFS